MVYKPPPLKGGVHVVVLVVVDEKVPPAGVAVQAYELIVPSLSDALAVRDTVSTGIPAYTVDGDPVIEAQVGGVLVTEIALVQLPVALSSSITVRVIVYEPMVAGAVQVVVVPVVGDKDPPSLAHEYKAIVPSLSDPAPISATVPPAPTEESPDIEQEGGLLSEGITCIVLMQEPVAPSSSVTVREIV